MDHLHMFSKIDISTDVLRFVHRVKDSNKAYILYVILLTILLATLSAYAASALVVAQLFDRQQSSNLVPSTSLESASLQLALSKVNSYSKLPANQAMTSSLRQITSGGCCVQPFFSPDSQQILFIDKPAADIPTGIYGIDLADPQSTSRLINSTIGFRSPDRTIVASIESRDVTRFTHEVTGQSWIIDTDGNWPRYSPDSSKILWVATDREGPYDRRQGDIWLADLDGGNRRLLLSLYGGGLADWFSDSRRVLLIGRDAPDEEKLTLYIYEIDTGHRINLFSHKRLRGGDISPGGSWIVFFLSFADNPEENGLWLISTDGATQRKLELPNFGAYQWRDDNTLLLIPMRTVNEESMQLWAIDAPTGQAQPLTDPTTLSFSISNGDWDVSPDGRHVVFVSSADQNIWLITLP